MKMEALGFSETYVSGCHRTGRYVAEARKTRRKIHALNYSELSLNSGSEYGPIVIHLIAVCINGCMCFGFLCRLFSWRWRHLWAAELHNCPHCYETFVPTKLYDVTLLGNLRSQCHVTSRMVQRRLSQQEAVTSNRLKTYFSKNCRSSSVYRTETADRRFVEQVTLRHSDF